MGADRVGEVVDARGGVDLEDGVLAHEDGDVFVAGLLLPVVEKVEGIEEEGGFGVGVVVPHAAGGERDVVIGVLVESGGDIGDVGVCGFEAVVEIGESIVVGGREEVFVADLDIIDLEGLRMAVGCT